MAKFDLTTKNCEFLDRHLTFPLLEFLLSKDVNITDFRKIFVFLVFTTLFGFAGRLHDSVVAWITV